MRADVMMFRLPAALALAAILSSAPASGQAGWQEYEYPRDGFAARYPVQPVMSEHAYETRLGSAVTERVYSAESEGVTYLVAIADFGNARPGRDEAIDEAADRLIASGRLTHDVSARLNWNYGRELRVEGTDGNSYTDAIFLIGSKLVQLKVIYPLNNSQCGRKLRHPLFPAGRASARASPKGDVMRLTALVAAALIVSLPASAQGWKEYSYPDSGFYVHFPADPQVSDSTYTMDGKTVKARVYSLEQEQHSLRCHGRGLLAGEHAGRGHDRSGGEAADRRR